MELRKSWCRATAHPSYQKDWTEDNPSYGQCCVTALVIQDLYGGDIYECKVQGKMDRSKVCAIYTFSKLREYSQLYQFRFCQIWY